MLRLAKKATGLPVVSEIMNQTQIDMFEGIDIVQAGASNMDGLKKRAAIENKKI